jgi:hypothetical protein
MGRAPVEGTVDAVRPSHDRVVRAKRKHAMTMGPGYGERPPTGTFGGEGPQQGQVKDTARHEAKVVRDHMKSQAREARDKARARAATSFDNQKGRVARDANDLASALRETAERLDARDQGNVAVYVRSAANIAERVAGSIEQQDYRNFAGNVDRVSRNEPLVVFAGAAALGFLASRAIRSYREDEQESIGGFEEESEMSGGTEGPAY